MGSDHYLVLLKMSSKSRAERHRRLEENVRIIYILIPLIISCHPHTFNTHMLCEPLPLMKAAEMSGESKPLVGSRMALLDDRAHQQVT